MSFVVRKRLVCAALIVLLQVVAAGTGSFTQTARAQEPFQAQAAPSQYIITVKTGSGFSASSVSSAYAEKSGVKVKHVYDTAIQGFAGSFSDSALAALQKDPNVASITPDLVMRPASQLIPTGINRADADLNLTKAGDNSGSVSVDVAVLDTGVYQHSDLNVVGGYDCVGEVGPYYDPIGHGTHVAGTIGAYDNGDSVVGIAPGARIYSVKVLPAFTDGTMSDVICGLDWVAARSSTIDVVNMSLGGGLLGPSESCGVEPMHQAFCNVVNRGVTIVVAAGNFTDDAKYYAPASYNEAITVSAYADLDGKQGGLAGCHYVPSTDATECDDSMASFSNYGQDIDIAAPGVDIKSTAPGGGTATYSGTSMASPHVAGAAALVIAQQGKMSPASVKARLLLCAEPGPIKFDLDSYKEPILNVAFLGKGKIAAPSSVKAGDSIQVRAGDFTPGTRAIFRFNGTYIGGDTIDNAGRGHRNYTIPEMPGGTYKATISNGLKSVSKSVKVLSVITSDHTSAPVGETVNITLSGFGANDLVDVKLGTRTVVNDLVVSTGGAGGTSFVVPTMPGGYYSLAAKGTSGKSASVTLKVAPSAYLYSGAPAPGSSVSVAYRGFKAGENIVYRIDTQSGDVINTPTETASSTGSGVDTITIPDDGNTGLRYVWVMGDQGSKVRISLTVNPAELPEPTATATQEPSGTPVVESPTAIPSDTPVVETPTEAPTETPVAETPTEVPTELPTTEASPVVP